MDSHSSVEHYYPKFGKIPFGLSVSRLERFFTKIIDGKKSKRKIDNQKNEQKYFIRHELSSILLQKLEMKYQEINHSLVDIYILF